jgi:hypothetical protein
MERDNQLGNQSESARNLVHPREERAGFERLHAGTITKAGALARSGCWHGAVSGSASGWEVRRRPLLECSKDLNPDGHPEAYEKN